MVKEQVSRFHKVLHDEIWNFYEGDPLRLLRFDGKLVHEEYIGKETGKYVSIIRGGEYQAAETMGEYSLVGCSVAPGFDFADFSFLSDIREIEQLNSRFPDYKRFV